MAVKGVGVAHWEPMLEQVMRERSVRLLAYAAMVTGNDAGARALTRDATFAVINPVASRGDPVVPFVTATAGASLFDIAGSQTWDRQQAGEPGKYVWQKLPGAAD